MLRLGVVLTLSLMLSGCDVFGFREWEWKQKLTVSVMTPSVLKTASSVTDGRWSMTPTWFKVGDTGGGPGAGSLQGEAVVVELEPQRFLFALLRDYSAITAVETFADPGLKPGLREHYVAALDRMEAIRESRSLSREHYPLFVTFDNVNDPASVRRVDPGNLSATFGAGYRMNAITLSITDEPVTQGVVERVLGWLETLGRTQANLKGKPKVGLVSDQSDPKMYLVAPSDFSTGLYN